MKQAALALVAIGIVLIVIAVIWHLGIATAGQYNPFTPRLSSPSSIAVFANALMLMGVIGILLGKKE